MPEEAEELSEDFAEDLEAGTKEAGETAPAEDKDEETLRRKQSAARGAEDRERDRSARVGALRKKIAEPRDEEKEKRDAQERRQREIQLIAEAEDREAAYATRAAELQQTLAATESERELQERPFGKEHMMSIGRPLETKPGDLITVQILNERGEKVFDLWETVNREARGTKIVAGKALAYDRENDAIVVPILDPPFLERIDRSFLGVLLELEHAKAKEQPTERNYTMVEAHAREEELRLQKNDTPDTRRRFRAAEKQAATLKAKIERPAWQRTLATAERFLEQEKLNLTPGYGSAENKETLKAALEAKMTETLREVETKYLGATDVRGRSLFTELPAGKNFSPVLKERLLRKGWVGRGMIGFLDFFTMLGILTASGIKKVWNYFSGKEEKKEGGKKK